MQIKAIASENIPANRLCCLDNGENPDIIYVRLAMADEAADFCSKRSISAGEEVVIDLDGDGYWEVELGETSQASSVGAGISVNVLDGGLIGVDGNLASYIGYTLESGEVGDVVKIKKLYKVKASRINP
jgi:hypothetical protein